MTNNERTRCYINMNKRRSCTIAIFSSDLVIEIWFITNKRNY